MKHGKQLRTLSSFLLFLRFNVCHYVCHFILYILSCKVKWILLLAESVLSLTGSYNCWWKRIDKQFTEIDSYKPPYLMMCYYLLHYVLGTRYKYKLLWPAQRVVSLEEQIPFPQSLLDRFIGPQGALGDGLSGFPCWYGGDMYIKGFFPLPSLKN